MTEKDSIEKSHQIANEWFVNHKALKSDLWNPHGVSYLVIDWRRPDTGNYSMKFIIAGSNVIVIGDVGDAIYAFERSQTLEMLKTYDWHYFVGKCVASETGRKYTMKMPGIKHEVPNVRAIGHFIGLQMAIKQLNL